VLLVKKYLLLTVVCTVILIFSISIVFATSASQEDMIEIVDGASCYETEQLTLPVPQEQDGTEICNTERYENRAIQLASREGNGTINEDIKAWLRENSIEETFQVKEIREPETVNMEVPSAESANTGFKSFMDYRTITDKRSDQYKLQQKAITNDEGFRIYDQCYMVAMGTYYVSHIGDKFRITLEDGTVFYAVAGDVKSDLHTDAKHQHKNGNIVEFIVDMQQISSTCRKMGDMSYAGLAGKIKSIERIV